MPPRPRKSKTAKNTGGVNKNPHSLIDLLTMIRVDVAGLSRKDFLKELNKLGNGPWGRAIKSERTIGKLERNEERLTYAHLEVYRDCVGLTAGLLLLFSR